MAVAYNFLWVFLGLAAPVVAGQHTIGIFGTWGAFADDARCYAIAAPYRSRAPEGARPFAAVGFWPQRHLAGQFHVRLSGAKRAGSAVLLRVDDRTFQLSGNGRDAWAPDAAADDAIADALRTGIEMSVETRAEDGRRVRDSYRLRGAATAMDAAAIACRRR
jgi:hypothetical protein